MKPTRLLSIIASLVLASLVLGCTDHGTRHIIACADSLSLTRPDSAMAIMDSIGQTKDRLSHSEQMYYELIRAKVQNRAYIDFTTDSVMLLVADYYDHHGSANDRMLAHYLLGCTYRDLKEAPMSLQCYYDAVEAADTTSSDCDYRTMMSIWGQIATILDKQYMPMEELDALNKYQKYALQSCDTFNYIRGIEMKVLPYTLMADTASILKTIEDAVRLYKEHGYFQQAARALPCAIMVYLDRHDLNKTHELQLYFEKESGLFDTEGNIAKGREFYYRGKGSYYFSINNMDSAEFFYRKELVNRLSIGANQDMMRLYGHLGNLDSVLYYANMMCLSFNQQQTELHAQAMHQVKGMYDYARNQKIAHQKEQEAQKNKLILYVFIVTVIIAILLTFSKYCKYRNRKFKELASLNSKYLRAIQEIESANEELHLLKTDSTKLQERKQAEINRLKDRLQDYEVQIAGMTNSNPKETFLNSDIVLSLKDDNRMAKVGYEVTESEWNELQSVLKQCMPSIYYKLSQGDLLTRQETHISILTLMNVGTKEMSNMLQSTPSRISNAKASANQKLFNDQSGAQSLRRNILAFISKA